MSNIVNAASGMQMLLTSRQVMEHLSFRGLTAESSCYLGIPRSNRGMTIYKMVPLFIQWSIMQAPMQMGGALSLLRASQDHIAPDPYFVSTDKTGRESASARGIVDMVDRNRKIIAGAQYPRLILGGDRFLDYWGAQTRPELATIEGVYRMIGHAYELGVRGFDLSLNGHVIEAFRKFKLLHDNAIGIGNPNWRCGIKLGESHLMDLRSRVLQTLRNKYLTAAQLEDVARLPVDRQKRWFAVDESSMPLTSEDVENIHLDEKIYRSNLEQLIGVVDYILVGTDYADWLVPMQRSDILLRMLKIVREYGFRPLSISHWASVTLPMLDQMDFEGHWIYSNASEQLLSYEAAQTVVGALKQPITAFRVLGGGGLAGNLLSAAEFLKHLGVRSVVIGAEEPRHLDDTITVFKSVFGV